MIKRTLLIVVLLFSVMLPAHAGNPARVNETISARHPKPAFWKSNRIDLFYPKKSYNSLSDKYKNFSVGIMEIQDLRMTKFYHKKDKFFQTNLIPTLQFLLGEELKNSNMFKSVELIYEPYKGEMTPKKMEKIQDKYKVDMIMLVNLTDFQIIRGMSDFHQKMMLNGDNVIPVSTLDGMDLKFKIGGIFQLIFLPLEYVVWSDTVQREYLKFAPKGRLKNKEVMQPIVQNLLSQVMTDMLYLISEDGKVIKSN